MKNKHMFSLLDQSFTTVHVIFDSEPSGMKATVRNRQMGKTDAMERILREQATYEEAHQHQSFDGKAWIYKAPTDWNLVAGDNAVVLNTNGSRLAVVTVVKVDDVPVIDVDADFDYKWLVQKVDMNEHNDLVSREARFSETMLEVERTKQRESLVTSFRESLPEGSEARRLFESTTASLTPPPAPPTPPMPDVHPRSPDEGHLK